MKTSICLFLAVITSASVAVAQNKKDKIEIGIQTTSLTLFGPDFQGDVTQSGFGGRVTYNFNRSIAAEAEINFFAQKLFLLSAEGKPIQAQFGVKLGKRFEKLGLFAKVRPGFLTVDKFFSIQPGSVVVINGLPKINFITQRATLFTIDVGGVLELYPSRRIVVRFDAGDTAIRHPTVYDIDFSQVVLSVQLTRPAKFNYNFQFTAGVAFRPGDFPAEEGNLKTSVRGRKQTRRFEVGVQYTSLSVDPPSRDCDLCLLSDEPNHTETGLGGRFTLNLTENVAFEAEVNFYTRNLTNLPNPSGYMFQAQFGAKIGRRFDKWGLFGKARPGFVGFTKVNELSGTHVELFFGTPVIAGDFRVVNKYYPSIDLGGVVEFYFSPRWLARFDIGDTVIRYGEVPSPTFSFRNPLFIRPPETHHNLQFTSGIGFRF